METPCLCPPGHKHGGRKVTETFAIETKIIVLKIRNIEINASSSASNV